MAALLRTSLLTLSFASGLAAQQPATAAPQSAPKAKTQVLAGRCADAEDRPVPIAKVELWRRDYRTHRTELLRTSVVDADARFRFDGLPALGEADWGWTYYYLIAQAPKHAIGVAQIRSDGVPAKHMRVVLGVPSTVKGRVVDEAGQAIAGVTAYVWVVGNIPTAPTYNGLVASEPNPFWAATSDAKGHFAITSVPDGAKVRLILSHPKFAKTRAVSAGGDVEVVMAPGGVVTGRVVYPDGKPASRVRVQAQGVRNSGWASVQADADGRYRLESLHEGTYNIWADADEWTVVAHASFAVEGGKTHAATDLKLIKGGFIEGVVRDATTGKPLRPSLTADVGLYGPARPKQGAAIQAARIGADGKFRIRAAPGRNYIYIRAGQGWMPAGDKSFWVEVKEGGTVRVEFRVAETGAVELLPTSRRRR